MAYTLAQKLIAKHAIDAEPGDTLSPGNIVTARLSFLLANDVTTSLCVNALRKMKVGKVFDKDKIALVMDHFTPQMDIASADQVIIARNFAKEQNITHYFEGGDAGVEHALLPELGLVGPGDLVIGADSHTCTYGALGCFATGMGSTDVAAGMALGETWLRVPDTIRAEYKGTLSRYVSGKDLVLWLIGQIGVDGARYKALEFGGPVIDSMSVEGRMTMANMAIEAGGKCGLFAADTKTLAYSKAAGHKGGELITPDPGATYERVISCDVTDMEPQVACPHLPENVKPVGEVKNITVNQVIIGSCTNGRIEDLRIAAEVFKDRKVKKGLRCIVLPATPTIWKAALKEGLVETMLESGCIMGPASCGPCPGGHLGVLGGGEKCLSTTNRNFRGRMGSLEAEVYLANPAVAAATAITGIITHPAAL